MLGTMNKLNVLINLSITHPKKILTTSLVILLLLAWQATSVQQDGRVEALVSKTNQNVTLRNDMELLFGSGNIILIGIQNQSPFSSSAFNKTLKVIDELEQKPLVQEVHSIFNKKFLQGGDGHFEVKDIVSKNANTKYDFDEIIKRLKSSPIYHGNLISLDYQNYVLAIEFVHGTSDQMATEFVEGILQNNNVYESWLLSGLPVIHHDIKRFMDKDMNILVPLFLVAIIIFLFISFRSLRGVIIPFVPILYSLITAFGVMGMTGIKITIVTNLIPMLLIAIGAAYSVHFINQYYLQLDPKLKHVKNIKNTGQHIAAIIFLSGITTVIGFLSNLFNPIIAIRDFSIILSIGVLVLMLGNLILVPALLSLLKQQNNQRRGVNTGYFNKLIDVLLDKLFNLVIHYKTLIVICSLLLISIALLGIKYIKVESSGLSFFKEDSRLVQQSRKLSQQYGGVVGFDFLIDTQKENGAKRPAILQVVDEFNQWLKESYPLNIKVTHALTDYVKQMSKAYNGSNDYYKIPKEEEEISQYIEIYSWGADIEKTFRSVVEPSFSQLKVSGRFALIEYPDGSFKEQSVQNQEKIIREATAWLKERLPSTVIVKPFGEIMIVANINRDIIYGQIVSLCLAIFAVLIITMVVFRSLVAGLLCLIPVSIATLVSFGVMGIFNIPLNIATALVSAMAIGIGIDDTIHFIMTLKKQQPTSTDIIKALKQTFQLSGRAIIYTTIALSAGYAIMLASSFTPVVYFSVLNIITILFATLAALLTLPATILVMKPKFLLQNTLALEKNNVTEIPSAEA